MKKPHTRIRKAAKRTVKDSGDGTTREEILWLPNQKFDPVRTTNGRRSPGGFKTEPVHVEEYRVPAGIEVVKAMSEVQKECIRLQETLDHLTNLADSLESNLDPVLQQTPANLPHDPSAEKEHLPLSPVGAQLRSFDTQARKIQETLSFILERLAV